VGDHCINNDSQHQRNVRVHANQALDFIVELVVHGRKAKNKIKIVHFVAIFHLLEHGRPMIDFEHMRGLFDFLKVHHTPRKH